MSEKNTYITVRMSPDLKAALQTEAYKNGFKNLSRYITAILERKSYPEVAVKEWWRENTQNRSDT